MYALFVLKAIATSSDHQELISVVSCLQHCVALIHQCFISFQGLTQM